MRVGIGYDVHKLSVEEDLILGGVTIDYHRGLVGHSDADVLVHAIMDALLGAIAAGDIGSHFPDDDPQYKGVSSLVLLEQVLNIVKKEGYLLNNLDTVVAAQKPKLAPYIKQMEANISSCLQVKKERINVKATTTEKLGFVGREEGISAQAIVTLKESGK